MATALDLTTGTLHMPKNPKPKRVSVKIDERIWKKATVIAHAKGKDLADYLDDLLRKPVDRDYPGALDDLKHFGEPEVG